MKKYKIGDKVKFEREVTVFDISRNGSYLCHSSSGIGFYVTPALLDDLVVPEPESAMSRTETLRHAIDTYGAPAQSDMMLEEMNELTKAILKLRRAGNAADTEQAVANIREEIADVQIMLDQMKLIYGDVADVEAKKLTRLAERLDAADAPIIPPRFDWELFSTGKQAVNCRTEHDAEVFLAWLAGKGEWWHDGDAATKFTGYNRHKENTCYALNFSDDGIEYGEVRFYTNSGLVIIPFTREMLA